MFIPCWQAAIFIAVIGTGLIGWLLNIVMVLCSGPLKNLPGPSGSAFLQVTPDFVLLTLQCKTSPFADHD